MSPIARLASRQHGLVAYEQLLGAGFTRHKIAQRVQTGQLIRIHRGVYAVGHTAPSPYAPLLAAVLACGPGSVLSVFSAAVLWALLPASDGPIHVTLVGGQRRPPSGVRVHRCGAVDVTRRHGIPVTTPLQTLLDLAAQATDRDLARGVEEARVRRLVRDAELLEHAAGRPGAARLRRLLEHDPALTRSEAERRLLELLDRAKLSRPKTNVRIAGHEVDAVWPEQRLVVEVDGYAYHSSRSAFERDRLRDLDLDAAGYRVLRTTWRQLTREPVATAVRIGRALNGHAAPHHESHRHHRVGRP